MNIVLLGGQSPRHFDWVRTLKTALEKDNHRVFLHDYAHWHRNEPDINLALEMAALPPLVAGKDAYIIVAKSIGSVVASLANAQGLLEPRACLFMGFPLKSAVTELSDQMSAALPLLPKTIILQNNEDPLGSDIEVHEYITDSLATQVTVESAVHNTHDYLDYDRIRQLVANLEN